MMKKHFLIFLVVFAFIGFSSNSTNKSAYISKDFVTCSGEFKIDGKSYTITLHDVSLWTCAKFKVGSWFK